MGSDMNPSEAAANVRSGLDSDLTATPDLRPLYPQLRT